MTASLYRAVAFDLDGTLVDSITDLAAAANAMREALGMAPLPQARICTHVGDGVATLVHRALTDAHDGEAPQALWEQGFALFVQHYRTHLADHTRPYPGVTEALGLLKQLQLPLAVVTNKSSRLAMPLLEQLGLAGYFCMVLGGDSLPEKKPSAMPLLHVAEQLALKPGQLLMVGDSANDVLAARAAGCGAAVVAYGYADAATLGADHIVTSLVELYDLLKNESH